MSGSTSSAEACRTIWLRVRTSSDQAHQGVEQVHVHADRGVGDGTPGTGLDVVGLGRRRLDGLDRCRGRGVDACGLRGLDGRRGCDLRCGQLHDGRLGHEALEGLDRLRGSSGRDVALEDGGELVDDVVHDHLPLGAVDLDGGEELAHHVHHPQQDVGGGGRHGHVTVTQARQQVLPHVGHRLEPVEGQEARGALDRVDGAEDAREQLGVARRLLEVDEVAVELVEVLVALHEELLDDLVQRLSGPFAVSGTVSGPRRCADPWSFGGDIGPVGPDLSRSVVRR
jgi:hypothetical protein